MYNKIMIEINGIKSQDILILLKIVSRPHISWRLVDLASELGLSQSEVSMGLLRARNSGLVDSERRTVRRKAFHEFIVHGLKYVFPAKPGPIQRGIPTAHSAPSYSLEIQANENDQFVWPSHDGLMRGQAIAPLYPSAPFAAKKDDILYEWLVDIDVLRIGKAREKEIAISRIGQKLSQNIGDENLGHFKLIGEIVQSNEKSTQANQNDFSVIQSGIELTKINS